MGSALYWAARIRVLVAKWWAPRGVFNCHPLPPPSVSATLIHKAHSKMECGESIGPFGIIAEWLKAVGKERVELAKQLVEDVFSSGEIPADWEEKFALNLHKGKWWGPVRGYFYGLRITYQVMKLPGRVLDFYVHNKVNTDEVEFGFGPGKGTTDGISIVYQLQENYIAINKPLCFTFDELEKTFDRVPRGVLW